MEITITYCSKFPNSNFGGREGCNVCLKIYNKVDQKTGLIIDGKNQGDFHVKEYDPHNHVFNIETLCPSRKVWVYKFHY